MQPGDTCPKCGFTEIDHNQKVMTHHMNKYSTNNGKRLAVFNDNKEKFTDANGVEWTIMKEKQDPAIVSSVEEKAEPIGNLTQAVKAQEPANMTAPGAKIVSKSFNIN